jgi:hypothetical protein
VLSDKPCAYVYFSSGRLEDKFAATKLTPVKSDVVDAPYVGEFPVILECKVLHTIEIGGIRAKPDSIQDVRDNIEKNLARSADVEAAKDMVRMIKIAKENNDSIGGVVEGIAINMPVGLGEPVFDTMEGDLAKALFAIPAIKAVEFGSGFSSAAKRGSENNDPFTIKDGKIVTEPTRRRSAWRHKQWHAHSGAGSYKADSFDSQSTGDGGH